MKMTVYRSNRQVKNTVTVNRHRLIYKGGVTVDIR